MTFVMCHLFLCLICKKVKVPNAIIVPSATVCWGLQVKFDLASSADGTDKEVENETDGEMRQVESVRDS